MAQDFPMNDPRGLRFQKKIPQWVPPLPSRGLQGEACGALGNIAAHDTSQEAFAGVQAVT